MKNIFLTSFGLLMAALISGCIKDTCSKSRTYSYYQPVYQTLKEVKANIKSNAPQQVERPGKLYVRGNYIFLNEIDKGVHIIDNSNPAAPQNIAFINIPGNLDIAVKGNALYADLYSNLVTIDISNPLDAKVKDWDEGVFPNRNYGYGFRGNEEMIIVDWLRRDTLVTSSCTQPIAWREYYMDASFSTSTSTESSSPVGKGGSMARFAVAGEYMYTVSNSFLKVFDLSTSFQPQDLKAVNLGNWSIETIFPLKSKLFIGSQSGLYIYDISNPTNPVEAGRFAHVTSCDPVIADQNYAYVTLRSGNSCQGFTNQLDVLTWAPHTAPKQIESYPMFNPHGLSKDGSLLFVCDGAKGLKIYDAENPEQLELIQHIKGLETYDVIALGEIALVVAKDGLYEFDYSDPENIHQISKIEIDQPAE